MLAYTHAGKQAPEHWVFPKGRIAPGESAEKAAQREVREEAGVEADILMPIGATEYHIGDEAVRVQFFLMRYVVERMSPEGRRKRWCTYEEGLGLLSFEDARDLLRRAHTAGKRWLRPGQVP